MLAIVGTVGVPACYGGFETLVENLLEDSGERVLVYCSAKHYPDLKESYKNADLKYVNLDANGVQSIFYDVLCIVDALRNNSRKILVLGVSGAIILPFVRAFTNAKIVTNIDGLEWKRDKWGRLARAFLKFSERSAVRFSHVIIADNQGIADYVYNEYGVKSEVIAYGGDHVLTRPVTRAQGGYAFSVCRIEPENNVHIILKAFSEIGLPLKFVGNWNASDYGAKLKQEYSDFSNIEIIDPVYDLDELFKYRDECSIYIHGHSAGGTNPSLVEAMFFAKQIIAFDCVYNRATMNNNGLYFRSADDIQRLLLEQSIEDWSASGEVLRNIAEHRYTWQRIRESYLSLLTH